MLPYKENVLKGNVKIRAVHMGTLSLSQRLREQQGQSINYRSTGLIFNLRKETAR